MASPLTTDFVLKGQLNENELSEAREHLLDFGVTRLENVDGVIILVTYDASRITYTQLLTKLKNFGIPV